MDDTRASCHVRLDENTATTVRRHGNPSGPRLVLTHGNGLAADLYYPFWSLLANDFDLMVYDLRNHGWNAVGVQRDHNIPTLIFDHDIILDAIVREYGEKTTIGVFHSLSTLVALLSFNDAYSALVLFDPPLCKPAASELEFIEAAERTAVMTRRRTERFTSRQQYAEVLAIIPGFARVVSGVRDLMAQSTLRKSAEGDGYELCCPRDYEAQIAEYVRSFSPLLDLSTLICPTKVIGADPTLPYAYLPTFDLSHASAVDYDFVPQASHFLQLVRSPVVAEAYLEAVGAWRPGRALPAEVAGDHPDAGWVVTPPSADAGGVPPVAGNHRFVTPQSAIEARRAAFLGQRWRAVTSVTPLRAGRRALGPADRLARQRRLRPHQAQPTDNTH